MSDLAASILEQLTRAIEQDQLRLPTLPEVALRVREAAEDPNVDVRKICNVIGNDAAISARIIKVVNSPLMRGSREIDNLQNAVSRLGITYSCNLATGLAMEQMFQATNDMVDQLMRETWQKSVEIAGISHVLCRQYTRLAPDQATLAGLLHRIGVLPILTHIEDSGEIPDEATLRQVIHEIHPILGSKILRTWDFPAEIADVPSESIHFDRDIGDKPDYADIVMVAILQSVAGTDHPYARLDWSQVKAFEKLGLDPEMEMSEGEDLSDEMEAAMALLG
ncbi:HDOD domain-containing protein [Aestuariirhabdus litorea]|uniref:HDOD domain-containing protein n=1 Tax=Aestuariirhabdus litorea TaxID=2528527 RepID=A0A3P3VRU1_9GAMM|nr:HDOD domain-containing protein [Aestuariirhabdus litorea]RRJ85164.1 HDOD domain-containing protein [Aestuariirhabdus litorea]RWW98386.1 HDOD domain-containing protein [Endozoicomonadaceae bacterium GTF-13]